MTDPALPPTVAWLMDTGDDASWAEVDEGMEPEADHSAVKRVVRLVTLDAARAWASACVEQERERAAQIALDEKVDADATGEPDDAAYNAACEHIADAIRKEPTPDTKGKAP